MSQRLIPLVLVLVISHSSFAETQTFTDTVRVVMGSRESQDEVRVYATQEAKRRVLDKVGVYLSGSSDIVRRVEESFGSPSSSSSFSDSTSVLQRIQTLTVGVVQTEVASEEWKTEGGAFVLYLVCRVTVDKDDALKRLTELLQDKQKVEDYSKVQEEVERLRGELAQLRADLESSKSEKETKAVKEEVQEKINGLGAADWFEKGFAAISFDEKIEFYTIAIQLNPNIAESYNNRGNAYLRDNQPQKAIEDYNCAIQLNAKYTYAYNNRGAAYDSKSKHDFAIADYTRAIQIDPAYAQAYYNRGNSYADKCDYSKAITDYNAAISLFPDFRDALYNRGLLYRRIGEKFKAQSDFQRAADLGDEGARRILEEIR